MPGEKSQEDREIYISDLVRASDKDHYLATLLAPVRLRGHLFALHSFDLEIQAIPDKVHEPLAGEIRIQWWRDWLQEYRGKGQSGNPVADSLHTAIETFGLPVGTLLEMLDGWSSVIQNEPVPDQKSMAARLIATEQPMLSLIAQVFSIEPKNSASISDLAAYAGYIRLLKNIGANRACARNFISDDLLSLRDRNEPQKTSQKLISEISQLALLQQASAQKFFNELPKQVRPAFAYLAAVGPELRNGNLNDAQYVKMTGAINPLKRQWRIWRAVRTGRF
ncbi:MAG: squalene/phytoene synthase family protein [Rhizobiales bacterium]|nr:squalene/phytoene synthase family protein [Hyphomicrobiales bacterium]